MQQVNLIKIVQENSGFFYKIILPGQFSLGSVGRVCEKSGICVAGLLGILLCSVLKSCTYVFRKQSSEVAVCVPTTALESTRCWVSCMLIRCICVNSPLTRPHQWEKTVLCQGEELWKMFFIRDGVLQGRKKVNYEWFVWSGMPGNFLLLYQS